MLSAMGRTILIGALGGALSMAPAATEFQVTNNGTISYLFDGEANPSLTFQRDSTYIFHINTPGHPFWINTVQSTGLGNAYNSGVTNNGTSSGDLTFVVPAGAPDGLFYNCQFHPLMTGTISIETPETPPAGEPVITSIEDVPDDQGRWVFVSWLRSDYDTLDSTITQYNIWEFDNNEGWVSLGIATAIQDTAYTFLARTFGDSNDVGIHWSKFKVTAHTIDPKIYYVSDIDSGYSVDNIAPAAPAGVVASVGQPNAIALEWDAPDDEDFAFFRVYRGSAAGFDPSGLVPLSELLNHSFADEDLAVGSAYYYRISTVDANGNESDYSREVSAAVLSVVEGMLVPGQYALRQNYPNPFNPSTTIRFDLPEASRVQLIIYDAMGREVRTLLWGEQSAGYQSVNWDGADDRGQPLSSGIYFYRLQAESYSETMKMVLLR